MLSGLILTLFQNKIGKLSTSIYIDMKKFKYQKAKFFLLGILFLFVSGSMFAQGPQGSQGQQGPPKVLNSKQILQKVSTMTENLSLRDMQQVEVLKINNEYYSRLKNVLNSTAKGEAQKRQVDQMEANFNRDILGILDAEQKVIYKANLKKKKANSPKPRQSQGRP